MKRYSEKAKIIILAIIFLGLFGWAESSAAATRYVDWDTGTDDAGCGAVGDPCKSSWATQLNSQLQAGDDVIISAINGGGVYYNPSGGVISATTAGVTWQSATGETVWLSATPDHTSNPWAHNQSLGRQWQDGNPVSIGAADVVIDGFYVWGNIGIGGNGDRATIKNSDLSGGGDGDGFPSVIRTDNDSANPPANPIDDLTVRNNRIHGNVIAYNIYPAGGTNAPLIMIYDARRVIIENNEIYDGLSQGIKWKDSVNQHTARYNWFHDMPSGIQLSGQNGLDWIYTYNNVFSNLSSSGIVTEFAEQAGYTVPYHIYNNTFYNSAVDIGWWNGPGGHDHIFNNIFYNTSSSQYFQKYDQNWNMASILYQNYNDYYATSSAKWGINGGSAVTRATTLSGWQTWLDSQGAGFDNGDDNSINTDPSFTNASGLFNAPTDFKRSTYPANGRGGSYPSVMGAYITGNETIGADWSTPADTTAPAAPSGLSVN